MSEEQATYNAGNEDQCPYCGSTQKGVIFYMWAQTGHFVNGKAVPDGVKFFICCKNCNHFISRKKEDEAWRAWRNKEPAQINEAGTKKTLDK